MSLVATASRILGRDGSRGNIVALCHRNYGPLAEQLKSQMHTRLSPSAAMEVVQSAKAGSTPEAVLKACGQLVNLHVEDSYDHFYRLLPFVQELAGTRPAVFHQANSILHSTANFHGFAPDGLTSGSEKGAVLSTTDFQKLLSESLVAAVAHIASAQFRLSSYDKLSAEHGVLDRQVNQLVRRLEVHIEEAMPSTKEVVLLFSWWSRCIRPSRTSRLAIALHRSSMACVDKSPSVAEAAQILEAVLDAGPGSKDLYIRTFMRRIEAGGDSEEDFGTLIAVVRRCGRSHPWFPEHVAKMYRMSLGNCALTCSPELLSRMLDAFGNTLVLPDVSAVFAKHPAEAWSGACMLLLRHMKHCEPDLFRSVATLRAATVDAADAAPLLDLCDEQLGREVGRALRERFALDELSAGALAWLFVAELGDASSSSLAAQLLLRVQASGEARRHVLQRLHTAPDAPPSPAMAEAVGELFVRELTAVFVTDVPHLCRLLAGSWRLLPAVSRRRAAAAAIGRVPEMCVDDVAPLLQMAPLLDAASLRRFALQLKSLLLSLVPVEACGVLDALLLQRLSCGELEREVVDYCADRLDALSDVEAYYMMTQLCNVSGYCRVPLRPTQVKGMMAAVAARLPREQAMAVTANLCWALAVNNVFNCDLFVALFSRYPHNAILASFDTQGGHSQRRLLQIYEHFQTLNTPLAGFSLPDDCVAQMTSCGLLQKGFKSARCKTEDALQMSRALEAIFPEAHSIECAAFGGTFIIVTPREDASVSGADSSVACAKRTLVFAVPRMSRFMFLQRADSDNDGVKMSGDMMLTLRNLEMLHGTKNYVVPYGEWMKARDSEQDAQNLMRAVISGEHFDGMATSSSSTYVCPPARAAAAAADDDVMEASSSTDPSSFAV